MDKAKYKANIPRCQQRYQSFWHTLKIEAFKPPPLGNSVWKLVGLCHLIPIFTSVLTWDNYYFISSWKVRICPLQCPLQTNMFCEVYTPSYMVVNIFLILHAISLNAISFFEVASCMCFHSCLTRVYQCAGDARLVGARAAVVHLQCGHSWKEHPHLH